MPGDLGNFDLLCPAVGRKGASVFLHHCTPEEDQDLTAAVIEGAIDT